MTNSASASADMFAPVYLPDGATIKRVGGLCIDNDSTSAAYDILMKLVRRDNRTNTIQTVAQVATDALSSSPDKRIRHTSSINFPTVDNMYTYSLDVRFGPDGSTGLIFYGFWIVYE
jgi:hypothetical protein